MFGIKCFILYNKDNLHNFDSGAYESIFLGYLTTSEAYQVDNKSVLVVEESMHIVFDESNAFLKYCEDCVGHSIERDVSSNEEMKGGVPSSKRRITTFQRK